MSFITGILDFIIHEIYSVYLVVLFLTSGLICFFFDTEHNYLFGHYKDYIVSFVFAIINISLAVLLILVKILHSRLVF